MILCVEYTCLFLLQNWVHLSNNQLQALTGFSFLKKDELWETEPLWFLLCINRGNHVALLWGSLALFLMKLRFPFAQRLYLIDAIEFFLFFPPRHLVVNRISEEEKNVCFVKSQTNNDFWWTSDSKSVASFTQIYMENKDRHSDMKANATAHLDIITITRNWRSQMAAWPLPSF